MRKKISNQQFLIHHANITDLNSAYYMMLLGTLLSMYFAITSTETLWYLYFLLCAIILMFCSVMIHSTYISYMRKFR